MSYDIALTILNVIWGLVLTGIGFEMVHNPPDTKAKKLTYRVLFVAFGAAVVATTILQSQRAESEKERAREATIKATTEAHQDQLSSQGKLSYMQGTLDAIAKFEAQYVANPPSGKGTSIDLSTALAIMKMAQLPATPPSAITPATGQPQVIPPRSQALPRPEITSVPRIFADGQIKGRNLGTTPRMLYMHIRVKPSARGGRNYGPEGWTADNLLGNLRGINDLPINPDIVQQWSDTAITLKFPSDYWQNLLSEIKAKAQSRDLDSPQSSDLEVGYQVRRDDESKTAFFYAQ